MHHLDADVRDHSHEAECDQCDAGQRYLVQYAQDG